MTMKKERVTKIDYIIKNINDLMQSHEAIAKTLFEERQLHLKLVKQCKRDIAELKKDLELL